MRRWDAPAIDFFIWATYYAVIEYRYRRQYRREVGPELLAPSPGDATAGPLNPKDRREQLDRLLTRAGFPTIAEIEPHFAPEEDTDMLLLE